MINTATVLSEGTLHPSPKQGATQTGVEEATKRFKKYTPYIFSSYIPGHKTIEHEGNIFQIRLRTNLIDGLIGHNYLYKVAESVIKHDIKIVHVRNRPLYMPVLRKLLGNRVKLVLHEHNQNIADTLSSKQAVNVLDSIDAYVGVSNFTRDFEITNKYSQYKKISHVILNGVNLEKFQPIWSQKDKVMALRDKYGIAGTKNVLFAGAIRERKGIHVLIEAFKLVVQQHPDAKLVVAGGSKDNASATDAFAVKVKESAKRINNNVVFLGYTPPTEIQDIYLLGDIFVGPSLWDEAFGLVFAEASATGLAVIGSNRGGIPEIIIDNKTGLLLYDPADPKEIAQKIMTCLESPSLCRDFGHAARKRMEENFSWDRVAHQIEDLYSELLK